MNSDVLILIDSCHSGSTILSSQGSSSRGRTEIIAACPYTGTAPSPHGAILAFTETLLQELEYRLGLNTRLPFTAASLHRGMSERLVKEGLHQARARAPPRMKVLSAFLEGSQHYSPAQFPRMPVYFNLCDDFSLPSIPLQPMFLNHDSGQNEHSDGIRKKTTTERIRYCTPVRRVRQYVQSACVRPSKNMSVNFSGGNRHLPAMDPMSHIQY